MMLHERIPGASASGRPGRQGGFTLVETMMISAVVTLIATGIMSSLPPMMKSADQATRLGEATALLEHVTAEVAEVRFENLDALDGTVVDAAVLSSTALADLDGFRAVLDHVELLPTLHKIEIDIVYRDPGVNSPSDKVVLRSAIYRSRR